MLRILKNHSILYAEDEPQIQASIAKYLENYFEVVYLSADGNESLALYTKYRPDVLLLDINLPGIDGLSLAREIRKQDQTVKIIMLTAHTEKEQLLAATELKLTKYLIKPVAPKAFKATMELLADELLNNPSHFIRIATDYIWDNNLKVLSVEGNPTKLLEKEIRLLQLFVNNKAQTITYEKIVIALWDDAYDKNISINSVKNQVSHLRQKLPERCIESIYGIGYILR